MGGTCQQVHVRESHDNCDPAGAILAWGRAEPLFWMTLGTRNWDLRVWSLQSDYMFLFQVTWTLKLELCPPQNHPWPEMNQKVLPWLGSHQPPRSGSQGGSHQPLAQRKQRRPLGEGHVAHHLPLLPVPAHPAPHSGPASAACWKTPGSMAWHCPLGATKPPDLTGPHPSPSSWAARVTTCSTGSGLFGQPTISGPLCPLGYRCWGWDPPMGREPLSF